MFVADFTRFTDGSVSQCFDKSTYVQLHYLGRYKLEVGDVMVFYGGHIFTQFASWRVLIVSVHFQSSAAASLKLL